MIEEGDSGQCPESQLQVPQEVFLHTSALWSPQDQSFGCLRKGHNLWAEP